MNNKGFLPAIPLIWSIIIAVGLLGTGLYVVDTIGFFGTSTPYGACGLGSWGKPCPMGYFCDNSYFVSGSCQPVAGIGGFWDRLLGSLSLSNLFCGQAGLLTPFCAMALPLASAVILAAVFALFALVAIPNKLAVYGAILLGVIFGVGFYPVLNLYYWLVIIFGIIAAIVGYKLMK